MFLQLDYADFKVMPSSVTAKIPMHVWEYLRSFPSADQSFVDLSDEQILREAEEAVDRRSATAALEGKEGQLTLAGLGGALHMGSIDLPRVQQVARYVSCRQRQSEQQKSVLARLEALKDNLAG